MGWWNPGSFDNGAVLMRLSTEPLYDSNNALGSHIVNEPKRFALYDMTIVTY